MHDSDKISSHISHVVVERCFEKRGIELLFTTFFLFQLTEASRMESHDFSGIHLNPLLQKYAIRLQVSHIRFN